MIVRHRFSLLALLLSLASVAGCNSGPSFPPAAGIPGAPDPLALQPHQRWTTKIDHRVWTPFTAYNTQLNLADEGKNSGWALQGGTIFRMNTRDPDYDYFLLELNGYEKVLEFNGCPYDARRAARYCEYMNGGFTMKVTLGVEGAVVGTVTEQSPSGRIDTRYYDMAVGASLASKESCEAGWTPGLMRAAPAVAACKTPISSEASDRYFPESVTGEDLTRTGGDAAEFKANFGSIDSPHCHGNFPRESTGEGSIAIFAIVRVPRTKLYDSQAHPSIDVVDHMYGYNRSIRVAAGSCAGLTTFDHRDSNGYTRPELLPAFHVPAAAQGLRVSSTGTVALAIDSHSHYTIEGLQPSLMLERDGAPIDPSSVGLSFEPDSESAAALARKSRWSFPPHGVWMIVAHNAVKGTYTVLVDTSPGGQADTLRNGPIAVPLTIQ